MIDPSSYQTIDDCVISSKFFSRLSELVLLRLGAREAEDMSEIIVVKSKALYVILPIAEPEETEVP